MARRRVAELVIGVLYAVGAGAQTFDTLGNSEEFYGNMANLAWIRPAQLFVEEVLLPNSVMVTVLVIVFEATAAVAILTGRAAARPALVAGGVFSIVGAITASPIGTVGYLILAAIHFRLAALRNMEHRQSLGP